MISTRRHLEALTSREHERVNLLFAVVASAVFFVFREMGRRQELTERREEGRRVYVDTELSELHSIASNAQARAEGAAEATKTRGELETRRIGWLTAAAGVATVVVAIIAYKLIH